MDNKSIQHLLENLGLSPQEANIYLATLKLGPASAIQISQKVGLTRQMVYLILPSLQEKGFIKLVKIGSKRLFSAVEPDQLQEVVNRLQLEVKKALPSLKAMQAENMAVPVVTVYENPLAMREWYRFYLKTAQDGDAFYIYSTGKESFWFNLDKDFYQDYLQKSTQIGVSFYLILPNNTLSRQYAKIVRSPLSQFRFRNTEKEQGAEIWIWRDQICYLTLRENATNLIVLESKPLADLENENFLNIWNQLEKNN